MVTRYEPESASGKVEEKYLGVSFFSFRFSFTYLLITFFSSGYLESGIERIVDQVLYPKMAGFQSQIEELVYSHLNIDRPKRKVLKEESDSEKYNPSSLLPKDLEAVSSPESEKQKSCNSQDDFPEKHVDENDDDFESPAFEPLERVVVESDVKKENDDSHLSGLSNMKSECEYEIADEKPQALTFDRSLESVKQEEDDDSQLSQISSQSRLSIVVQSEKDSLSPKPEVLNITEEAQMPKFNENSNSIDSRVPEKEPVEGQSLFDFKKEEIEFKGPCRKQMTLDEKLQEEIYESENKHGKVFKTEDVETNSHSSDLKLEIVEQNVTESESRLKIDIEATGDTTAAKVDEDPSPAPPKSEVSENEGKLLDKSHDKQSDSNKKERSSSHHKTSSSKSSKHSSKDRDDKRASSKHSSSHHSTSKSRYSDRDRHHSSSSKHKSSTSSGKDRDKSATKDRHRSRSSGHKSREQHSEDRQTTSRDKSASTKPPEQEMTEVPESEKKCEENTIQSPEKKTPLSNPVTPKPVSIDSDEDDFYGFPEQDTPESQTKDPEFTTPAKVPLGPNPNKSFMEEDSFYGFDDATPKKSATPSTSSSSTTTTIPIPDLKRHNEVPKPEIQSSGNGKRVRRPNTKYLSDDFTTHADDIGEDIGELSRSNKKRKKIMQDIVKLPKKQSVETKPEEKSTDEMPELVHQAEGDSSQSMKRRSSPETPEEQGNSSENPSKLPKSSKKQSKHDVSGESRSSSRRK